MNRRDLLKFSGLAAVSLAATSLAKAIPNAEKAKGHIILIVFDAWSAKNVGFLGYQRDTMPNLRKFAKKAAVYHNHISPGRFTVPGTASLITGLYPWSHRALNLNGRIIPKHQNHTVFDLLKDRLAMEGFAQNVYADQLLGGKENELDIHLPFGTYNLHDRIIYDNPLFKNDQYTAFNAFEDGIVQERKGMDASLFLGPLIRIKALRDRIVSNQMYGEGYYQGLPESIETYSLKDLADGLIELIDGLTEPSLVYFHVFVPHDPYRPYSKYFNMFQDDKFVPVLNEPHPAIHDPADANLMNKTRLFYDAFIASWDSEMARFYDYAEATGLVNTSHIVITADHGEMFDRGVVGHSVDLLTQPLVNVPLVISSPDRLGSNHYEFTSGVDVVPTIAKIAGVDIPTWAEGRPLPGYEENDPERTIYCFDSADNSAFGPLKKFSFGAIRKSKKIVYYQNLHYTGWELYDLAADPDERTDLFKDGDALTNEYKNLLLLKMEEFGIVYEG